MTERITARAMADMCDQLESAHTEIASLQRCCARTHRHVHMLLRINEQARADKAALRLEIRRLRLTATVGVPAQGVSS